MEGRIITDGFSNNFKCHIKFLMTSLVVAKENTSIKLRGQILQETATNDVGFRFLLDCKTFDASIVSGRAGSDGIAGKCTCMEKIQCGLLHLGFVIFVSIDKRMCRFFCAFFLFLFCCCCEM